MADPDWGIAKVWQAVEKQNNRHLERPLPPLSVLSGQEVEVCKLIRMAGFDPAARVDRVYPER